MMASGKNAKKRRSTPMAASRKQGLPWLTIAAVVTIVALAGGIFAVVFNQSRANQAAEDLIAPWVPSAENPNPATGIRDIFAAEYVSASHVTPTQRVAYDRFPPIGGPHDAEWAACNGVVYASAVRDENMVHPLEHGAVWIAYNPDTVAAADVDALRMMVDGEPYMTMSPYPGLDRPISLQAWGHQLKLDSASDERIQQFITALRLNPNNYPEVGATCAQPSFDLVNPPAFDPSPRGADAIPLSGEGATAATDEIADETGALTSPAASGAATSGAPTAGAATSGAPTSAAATGDTAPTGAPAATTTP